MTERESPVDRAQRMVAYAAEHPVEVQPEGTPLHLQPVRAASGETLPDTIEIRFSADNRYLGVHNLAGIELQVGTWVVYPDGTRGVRFKLKARMEKDFGPPPVHRNAKRTENLAALRMLPHAGSGRRLVLETLYAHPHGLTDEELAEVTGRPHNTIAPRRVQLAKVEWVEDSATTRPTKTGSEAIVWRLTAVGHQRMKEIHGTETDTDR